MSFKNLKLEPPAIKMLKEIAKQRRQDGNPVRTLYAIGAEAIELLFKKEQRKKKKEVSDKGGV